MTSLSDRQHCIALIDEAVVSGASLYKACSVIEVHHKTSTVVGLTRAL